jgi:hypothetical protein
MSKTPSDPKKPVQITAEALATVKTALTPPTLRERVTRAMEAISVVTLAMTAKGEDPDPCLEFDPVDAKAILAVLMRAYDELYWLTQLPTSVINADAPTDDQRQALDALGGVR